jgi:hydrogenase expression/formation protein HypE
MSKDFVLSCPLPITARKNIVMGHGSGGKLTSQLVESLFLPAFDNEYLRKLDDQAVFSAGSAKLAFSTDSFVVTPLFFPGGNIGELAVNGTVNDLAMSGARPLFLSAAFIIEEGLSIEELAAIVHSMGNVARRAGVSIVTGDTKVVNKGSADKLFITTSGVGIVPDGVSLGASNVCPGDHIIVSGSIADHGMAVMSVREGMEFEGAILSDTAPLNSLVETMLGVGEIHALRDPTRGGLATSLCEIASSSSSGIEIMSSAILAREDVRGACEILGLDPLYVANEGKLVAFVAPESSAAIVDAMRQTPLGADARVIGRVVSDHPGMVLLKTEIGGTRILDVPFSEQLPRIC